MPARGNPGQVNVFAETAKVTVPLPVPLAPPVTTMKSACETAVHSQPAGVVTRSSSAPPSLLSRNESGSTM